LVERWRKVERPLKKESCLLKIWQAWGKDAEEVQFILKRMAGSRNKIGRTSSSSRSKVHRTNSKVMKTFATWEKVAAGYPASETSDGGSDCVGNMQGNIQALLKIIISQRETIQNQLGKLKAKDMYLKTLDKSLSCSDGREYVLRNYLEQIPEHVEETQEESQDSGCGSGNDTQDSCNEALTPDHTVEENGLSVNESPVTSANKIGTQAHEEKSDDMMTELYEKLFFLNKKLGSQEDDIYRLTIQMEAMLTSKHNVGDKNSPNLTPEQEDLLHSELNNAQKELDSMAKINSRLGYEIKRNELALSNMMKNYNGRQQFAKRLEHEEEAASEPIKRNTGKTVGVVLSPTLPDPMLNRISEEETDWELGEDDIETDDDDSEICDEEIKARLTERRMRCEETFPVLAPPEQFQNCLSPSAQYETGDIVSHYNCSSTSQSRSQFEANTRGVASPAYSHTDDSISSAMTSSTTNTEKSVRFSNRDLILSTPEPRPPTHSFCWPSGTNISGICPDRGRSEAMHGSSIKVKSILKTEPFNSKIGGSNVPDVTSFLLDNEDGTLV